MNIHFAGLYNWTNKKGQTLPVESKDLNESYVQDAIESASRVYQYKQLPAGQKLVLGQDNGYVVGALCKDGEATKVFVDGASPTEKKKIQNVVNSFGDSFKLNCLA